LQQQKKSFCKVSSFILQKLDPQIAKNIESKNPQAATFAEGHCHDKSFMSATHLFVICGTYLRSAHLIYCTLSGGEESLPEELHPHEDQHSAEDGLRLYRHSQPLF
jgi:hypothetical protein